MNSDDKTFLMLKYNVDYDECTCAIDAKSLPHKFLEQFAEFSSTTLPDTIDKIIFSSVEGRKLFLRRLAEFNG